MNKRGSAIGFNMRSGPIFETSFDFDIISDGILVRSAPSCGLRFFRESRFAASDFFVEMAYLGQNSRGLFVRPIFVPEFHEGFPR